MNRRKFLGVAAASLAPTPFLAATRHSYEVVIIGAGLAGLSTAVRLKELGLDDIAIFEKCSIVGGRSNYSWGFLQGCENASNSTGLREGLSPRVWLENCGIKFAKKQVIPVGGTEKSFYTNYGRSTAQYLSAFLNQVKDQGISLFLSSSLQGIDLDTNSIEIVNKDGFQKIVYRNLILATGGFSQNPTMVRTYLPWALNLVEGGNPLNLLQNCALGEGHLIAQSLGASLVNMNQAIALPFLGGRLSLEEGAEIFLDKEGQRFIREDASAEELLRKLKQKKEKDFWILGDSSTTKTDSVEAKILSGRVKVAFTIKELASIIGIPKDRLIHTLCEYNELATTGNDLAFGRKYCTFPIEKPPFYIGKDLPLLVLCQGGIQVNEKHQVLLKNGRELKNIYACGECASCFGTGQKKDIGANLALLLNSALEIASLCMDL